MKGEKHEFRFHAGIYSYDARGAIIGGPDGVSRSVRPRMEGEREEPTGESSTLKAGDCAGRGAAMGCAGMDPNSAPVAGPDPSRLPRYLGTGNAALLLVTLVPIVTLVRLQR
jgi:hypothetical protein